MDLKIQVAKVGPIKTNCYVVSEKSGEAIVIDPGAEVERILELLSGLKLKYILLTHGHFDHASAVDDLHTRYPNAPIYLSEYDVKLFNAIPEQGAYAGHIVRKQLSELETVSDGMFLPFADYEIEVIATPGHSEGSVCYRIGDCLFSGDTLFYHTHGRVDLPFSNPQKMVDSLDRILHLHGVKTVYPGHGKTTTIKEEVSQGIYDLVRQIPTGRIVTYGDIARVFAINPRYVGLVLHQNPYPGEVPCHRVVNSQGRVAATFAFGGGDAQRLMLESEGVVFINNRIDLAIYRFHF